MSQKSSFWMGQRHLGGGFNSSMTLLWFFSILRVTKKNTSIRCLCCSKKAWNLGIWIVVSVKKLLVLLVHTHMQTKDQLKRNLPPVGARGGLCLSCTLLLSLSCPPPHPCSLTLPRWPQHTGDGIPSRGGCDMFVKNICSFAWALFARYAAATLS